MSANPLLLIVVPGAATVAILGWIRGRLAGTTLIAPWTWSIVAVVAVMGVEGAGIVAGDPAPSWLDPLRYVAACATFCPMMAVMGAKRPQDRGWQWVVLTLWVTAALPALQTLTFHRGEVLAPFAAWKLFVVGLWLLGVLNYLPTTFACSAILVATAQLVLFQETVFGWQLVNTERGPIVALWLLLAAAIAGVGIHWFARRMARQPVPTADLGRFEHQWRGFRDAFGAFWGLRVAARVNETAALRKWPVRLDWTGFQQVEPREVSPSENEEIEQCFETLLRRFVKPIAT